MVMTASTVHMAMFELFCRGVAYIGYFDGEMQRLAGQRMVAVDEYGIALDLGHRNVDLALRATTLKLHAGLNVLDALKGILGHFLDQLIVLDAVAFFR